jgi:hypothetical protein
VGCYLAKTQRLKSNSYNEKFQIALGNFPNGIWNLFILDPLRRRQAFGGRWMVIGFLSLIFLQETFQPLLFLCSTTYPRSHVRGDARVFHL